MDLSNVANAFASVASFLYIWHQLGLAKRWDNALWVRRHTEFWTRGLLLVGNQRPSGRHRQHLGLP